MKHVSLISKRFNGLLYLYQGYKRLNYIVLFVTCVVTLYLARGYLSPLSLSSRSAPLPTKRYLLFTNSFALPFFSLIALLSLSLSLSPSFSVSVPLALRRCKSVSLPPSLAFFLSPHLCITVCWINLL